MTFPVPDGFDLDQDDPRFAIPKDRDAYFAATGRKMHPIGSPRSYRIRIDGKTRKPFGRGLRRGNK